MRASVRTRRDGSVSLSLDSEAAHAVFASVLFASRFHEAIAPLASVALKGLKEEIKGKEGGETCR